MNKNNVKIYENPADNVVSDALSDFLRDSAQKMLKVAIEEEVQNFISSYKDKRLSNGNKQVVRCARISLVFLVGEIPILARTSPPPEIESWVDEGNDID